MVTKLILNQQFNVWEKGGFGGLAPERSVGCSCAQLSSVSLGIRVVLGTFLTPGLTPRLCEGEDDAQVGDRDQGHRGFL